MALGRPAGRIYRSRSNLNLHKTTMPAFNKSSLHSGAIVCTTLLLTACTTVSNPTDMRTKRPTVAVICSTKSVEDAAAALTQAWSRCFVKSGVVYAPGVGAMSTSPTTAVRQQEIEGGKSVMLINVMPFMGSTSISLLADIKKTTTCNAEVSVRPGVGLWETPAEYTSVWLDNPQDKGPGTRCW